MSDVAKQSTEFTGRSAEMRADNPWLASEDILELGDVKCVIEKVWFHKAAKMDGGRTQDVYTLQFKGKHKQMIINATNRKTLVDLFGVDTTKWIGKGVTLVVVKTKMKGEVCNGIRIKVPFNNEEHHG